jgi:hypothetical protein
MTISTTFRFDTPDTEGDLVVGKSNNVVSGRYIKRDTLTDAIHHNSTIVYHPDYSFLMELRSLNSAISGSWEIQWEWEPGQYTEAQIDTFISVSHNDNYTTLKDFANHKVTKTLANADVALTSWGTALRQTYGLDSASCTFRATSEGVYTCISIYNNNYSLYTVESITIEAGASLTIDKQGTTCHLYTMGELHSGDTALPGFRIYNLTSSSTTLTNNNSTRVRITRVYK